MARQGVARQPPTITDGHLGLLLSVDDRDFARAVQIPLAVRRSELQLAVRVERRARGTTWAPCRARGGAGMSPRVARRRRCRGCWRPRGAGVACLSFPRACGRVSCHALMRTYVRICYCTPAALVEIPEPPRPYGVASGSSSATAIWPTSRPSILRDTVSGSLRILGAGYRLPRPCWGPGPS